MIRRRLKKVRASTGPEYTPLRDVELDDEIVDGEVDPALQNAAQQHRDEHGLDREQ